MEGHLSINKIADTLSIHRVTIYRRVLLWIKANCKRPFCRIGVPTEPEEHFVCPECGLDEFPEVTTKCGHRSCKQCAIVCDDCRAIWCPDCTYPEGELKLCDACLSKREQAREAAEAA
jgi:hypothetical protein